MALGVRGVTPRIRVLVGLIFGLFEAGMPVLGLLLGRQLAGALGHLARPVGGTLLGLMGLYGIGEWASGLRGERRAPELTHGTARLVLTGFALSIDNAVVGFALGARRTGIGQAALFFGVVSIALSLAGLELGRTLGRRYGDKAELLGGVLLVFVGIAVGTGLM